MSQGEVLLDLELDHVENRCHTPATAHNEKPKFAG